MAYENVFDNLTPKDNGKGKPNNKQALVNLYNAVKKTYASNKQSISKIDSLSNSVKNISDNTQYVRERVAPRLINVGNKETQQSFQYDPLAPQGRQVTLVNVSGKSTVGASNKDIESVLRKASFMFNEEAQRTQPQIAERQREERKEENETLYKKLSIRKKNDPLMVMKRDTADGFNKVFQTLDEVKESIIDISAGAGATILGGGGNGKPGKAGKTPKGPRGVNIGSNFGNVAGMGALGMAGSILTTGMGYDITSGIASMLGAGSGIQSLIAGGWSGLYGTNAYKGAEALQQRAVAAGKGPTPGKPIRDASGRFTGGREPPKPKAKFWTRFLAFLEKRAPALYKKIGIRLTSLIVSAEVTAAGALATGPGGILPFLWFLVNAGMSIYTAMECIGYLKEFLSIDDSEEEAPEPDSPSREPPMEGGQDGAGGNGAGGESVPVSQSASANVEELKSVSQMGTAKTAMDFLQKRGWTKEQAAGIVGNLIVESRLRTDEYNEAEDAYGIAQWRDDRKDRYEQRFGKPIEQTTFEEQLAYVDWELRNNEMVAGDLLRETKTATEAAFIVDRKYERSAGGATQERIDIANQLVDEKYADLVASGERQTVSPELEAAFPSGSVSVPDKVPPQLPVSATPQTQTVDDESSTEILPDGTIQLNEYGIETTIPEQEKDYAIQQLEEMDRQMGVSPPRAMLEPTPAVPVPTTDGTKLAKESSELEGSKMASAITPVIMNNMVASNPAPPCRFAPSKAPLPEATMASMDSSVKKTFNGDKWA